MSDSSENYTLEHLCWQSKECAASMGRLASKIFNECTEQGRKMGEAVVEATGNLMNSIDFIPEIGAPDIDQYKDHLVKMVNESIHYLTKNGTYNSGKPLWEQLGAEDYKNLSPDVQPVVEYLKGVVDAWQPLNECVQDNMKDISPTFDVPKGGPRLK